MIEMQTIKNPEHLLCMISIELDNYFSKNDVPCNIVLSGNILTFSNTLDSSDHKKQKMLIKKERYKKGLTFKEWDSFNAFYFKYIDSLKVKT